MDAGCWCQSASTALRSLTSDLKRNDTCYEPEITRNQNLSSSLTTPKRRILEKSATSRLRNVAPSSLWGHLVFQSDGAAAGDGETEEAEEVGGGKTEIIALCRPAGCRPAGCWKKTVSGWMGRADFAPFLSRENRKGP